MGRLVDGRPRTSPWRRWRPRGAGVEIALDVLGEGPERERPEGTARGLGLGEAVRFLDFKPRGERVAFPTEADALILDPSRERGGAVAPEAMSLGPPAIASDRGRPADRLDPSCGVPASPGSKENVPHGLADAIVRLARDPRPRRETDESGSRKVRDRFDWKKKIDVILDVRREAAGKGVVKWFSATNASAPKSGPPGPRAVGGRMRAIYYRESK